MSLIKSTNTTTLSVIALVGFFFIFRLALALSTGLGTGESYYFRGAYDVALSYLDQPPLFFWLSHLSLKLFGLNTLALRLPDVILFSGTTWVLFLLARQLFNEKSALYTVIIFNLSAVYVIDGIWFQPDAPLLFFWAVSLYVLAKIFFPRKEGELGKSDSDRSESDKPKLFWLWVLLGVGIGLTGLSKYHVVFFFCGMVLFILTRKIKLLKHPGLYVACIICGLFFLPILIWNYQHDWISIKFQSSRAVAQPDFTLHFDWFLRSFVGQALWLLPWIWIPIVYEFIRSYKLGKTDQKYWFFFCMALFPIVFFTLATLWADLSYHFHWQSVGYMILFIPLGATIAKKVESGSRRLIKRWLWLSGIFLYALLIVAAFQVQTGFWQKYGPKQLNMSVNSTVSQSNIIDPTMDSYDYTDLLTYFESNGLLQQSGRLGKFVGVSNWLLAGKVDWALKGKIPVRSFEERRNYIYYFNDEDYLGQDVIFITRDDEEKAFSDVQDNCSNFKKLDDVPITRKGKVELVLHLYTCQNFHI